MRQLFGPGHDSRERGIVELVDSRCAGALAIGHSHHQFTVIHDSAGGDIVQRVTDVARD